ncbi:MAG: VWA domain-containing protein, partial [Planctomycetota bacterium]
FEKEKEKPSLAMVLVIDKSGSMQGLPIGLARQAAKSTVDLLSGRDEIGVIGFDSQPVVVSELKSATLKNDIFGSIDGLQAGGGTNMYPAMVLGKEMLDDASAKIKHMICLSDGHTQEADHESLVNAMINNGITVSTVALGEADRHLLSLIAEIGRGRYYETNDPTNVPQIFTKETMQASKSAIKEDLFGTVLSGDHPSLAGFEEADLPFTLGYVMTQAKPTAQTLLITESGDPLLAISRFGLGFGLAYTSDLTDRWGGEWLAWSDCGKFWGQILHAIVRKDDHEGIGISAQADNQIWQIEIAATDANGKPQSNLDWEIDLLDQQGQLKSVEINETGLGLYVAEVPISERQNLTARLRDPESNRIHFVHYDRPYPNEYRLGTEIPKSLKLLNSIDHSSIRQNLSRLPIRHSVSHWFYIAALCSFLCGNLIRRLG